MKKLGIFVLIAIVVAGGYVVVSRFTAQEIATNIHDFVEESAGGPLLEPHPLSIESLRLGDYPGSALVVEQTLTPGSNYQRYVVSYRSEGLKQYALLTVPEAEAPEGGFPAIVFNHGYIAPQEYRTTERYVAYTDAFSRNGYVLLRPDYRGHGNSEGRAEGGYGSNAYTIDVLNAFSSLEKHPEVNPARIGMWGHSMGGFITLRSMVVNPRIKAGVIWGGVVASYPDLLERWRRRTGDTLTPFPTRSNRGGWRSGFIEQYGTPADNPEFWNSISANSYLSDISGPVQLHHGSADTSVPYEFSETLADELTAVGKENEVYIYPGDDHNISQNLGTALNRSVTFFNTHLK